MADRARVRVEGRVQGVGFRYATAAEARRLELTGWVRNVPSGEVEAEFEGEAAAVDAMLAWCAQGPALARVTRVVLRHREHDADRRHAGFEIRP